MDLRLKLPFPVELNVLIFAYFIAVSMQCMPSAILFYQLRLSVCRYVRLSVQCIS